MLVSENLLFQAVEQVFLSVLSLPIQRLVQAPNSAPFQEITSVVKFSGSWEGALVLKMSLDDARSIARLIFDRKEKAVVLDEVQDALGELVNTLSGSVRGLLPLGVHSSLPLVFCGEVENWQVPQVVLEAGLWFEWEGSVLSLTLVQKK